MMSGIISNFVPSEIMLQMYKQKVINEPPIEPKQNKYITSHKV